MRHAFLISLLLCVGAQPLSGQVREFAVQHVTGSDGVGFQVLVCYQLFFKGGEIPEEEAMIRRIRLLLERYDLKCPEIKPELDRWNELQTDRSKIRWAEWYKLGVDVFDLDDGRFDLQIWEAESLFSARIPLLGFPAPLIVYHNLSRDRISSIADELIDKILAQLN